MAALANPFSFAGPVDPQELIDRAGELERLIELAHGPHLARVEAPRRYGKTSLLRAALRRLADDGLATVLVDFEDVLSLGAVINRIERAYAEQLQGPLRRQVERLFSAWKLGLSLGQAGFSVTLQANPKIELDGVLRRLLSLPEELYERKGVRSYIVFDEVQDLLRVEHADGMVRSVIQHHLEAASYAFAGSAPSLMRRLFDEPKAPFMAQGVPVLLAPLPVDPLADYIEQRFTASSKDPGEALAELLGLCRGHPQRAMLLAHHVWRLTPPGGAATLDAWLDALAGALADNRRLLHAHWSSFSVSEQRAAKAIALSPTAPGSEAARALVGLAKGTVQWALEALEGRGELTRVASDRWRLTDPLLEHWLRESEL